MKKFFKGFGKKSQPKGTSPGPSPSLVRRGAGAAAILIGYDVKEKELGKLHKAAWTGDLAKVKQLAKKDPNLLDKENRTALHLACVCGHTEVVKELLEWKARTYIGDSLGKTPLIKSVECQQEECVRLLLHDVDVNLKDVRGETALHLAASVGNITITELLLEKRANVNLRNKAGCSPLHLAVTGKRELIAHRLLQDGADVDSIDSNERTPLMLACQDGNLTMVKLLLQNNSDTDIKDVKGWSADDIAVMQGHHTCSQLITDHNFHLKRPPSVVSTPRSGASFLPGSAQNTPRQDDTSTGFGAPAGNLADDDSGDETVSKASGTGGGYDSWNSDTDLSLATDDKKREDDFAEEDVETPKLNLSKMIKNMSESDDPATPRSGRIPELTEGEDEESKVRVQAQDSLSDHWSEPESPLSSRKRSATRVSFKRDEELSQVHNISAQDEESSEQEPQQRLLNNGQPEAVEGYTASMAQSKPESQQMSQEKMRALMEELGISDAEDITEVDFSEDASISIGDNSHRNQDDEDNSTRPGILKNWKQPSNLASDRFNENGDHEETDSAEQRHDGVEGDDSLCADDVYQGDYGDDTYEKFLMDSMDEDHSEYEYHRDNTHLHHGNTHPQYNDHHDDDQYNNHHDDSECNNHDDNGQYTNPHDDGYDRPRTDHHDEHSEDYRSKEYRKEERNALDAEPNTDTVEHLDEFQDSSDEQGDDETCPQKHSSMKRWSGNLHDDNDVNNFTNSLSEPVTVQSELGYTDETELDDFVIPVKLKRAKSLEDVDGDPEENSEWDSDVEGMLSPRQTHESLKKQESFQESDWDSTVDSMTPRNPAQNQYQQLKEEAIAEDVHDEGHMVGVSVDDMDLNLEQIAPAQSTPVKSSAVKPSTMDPPTDHQEEESAWDSEDELSHQDVPPRPDVKPAVIGQSVMGFDMNDESEEEEEESISEWELERQKLKEKKQEEEAAQEREQIIREEQQQQREEEERKLEEEAEQKLVLQQQRKREEEAEQRQLEAEREREQAEREQAQHEQTEAEQQREDAERQREQAEREMEQAERQRQIQEEYERQNLEVERLQELEDIEREKRLMEAEQQQREEAEDARRLEEEERQRTWEEDEKTRLDRLKREAQRELELEDEAAGHQMDHFESGDDIITRDETPVLQAAGISGPNGEELDRIHREHVTGNRSSNHPIEPGPSNPHLETFVRMPLQSDGNSYDEDDSMMSDTCNFIDSPRDNRHPAGLLGAGSLYGNLGIPPDDDGLSYTSTEDFGGELQTVPYGRDILSGMTFGDSTAAIKLQESIREQKRLLEREKSQKTLMENKNRLLLKENNDLQRKVQDMSEQRSSLEQVKLDLEAKNRSLAYNLNEEVEKKKNADVLLLKTKEQLDRKEEQYTSEMEAKQKVELSMRNVQMELRSAQSAIKQISDEKQDLERHLAQEKSARALQEQLNEEQQRRLRDTSKTSNQLDHSEESGGQETVEKLRAEVYALKMELDRQRARFKDDQSVLTNESEELQSKIDDLKNDLKLNEEALAHATMQYNVQLSSMRTENSMLSSTLEKERATKDKLEAELESMRSRQHTASLELERSQQARSEADRMHQREKEDFSKQLDRREQELTKSKDDLQAIQQRASTSEAKLTSLENELHMTSSTMMEKSTLSSQLQRDLDQLRAQHNHIDEDYRKEKDQVNKLQVKMESAQDRVNSLQHENLTLKQQLETAQHTLNDRTGLDINEKFSAMLSSIKSDHDKSRSSLEDKNSSVSEMSNRLREELRNSDNKRNNLEQELRRLNQDYNDAMKRCSTAEASLDVVQRAKSQLEQDRHQLRLDSEKSVQKYQIAHEKTLELQGRITELVDRLERAEHSSIVSSQQLAHSSANLQSYNKTRDEDLPSDEMESSVHKLQLENTKLETELKHERQKLELLQRDLDDSQKVRSSLEALCSNLKSSNAHLEDKLGEVDDLTVDQLEDEFSVTRTALHQEAEDNKDLWEKEVLSRSKLGLRIAQLDRQRQEVMTQLEEEKRRVRKAIESKRLVETKLEAEIDKNSLLQKEIVHLRAYLKSAKKKLKLNNIEDLNEFQNLLQDEMDHKEHLLHSKNRGTLESKISPSKAFSLDKNHHSMDGAYLSHRLSAENGFVDDFETAQIKREIEAKYRMELNRKLEDVNHYLEEQSQARDRLDHVRNNNEASLKVEKRKLEDEVSELRLKFEQAMAEKQSKDLEARRFRDLYDGEMKWRMKLGDQLQRSTDKSYDYKSRLSAEQQRNRLYGSVGNINSTLMGDNPYLEKSRISNRLDADDPLNRRLKAELDRSIAKHLEAGPHDNLKPILRHVEENPVLNSSLAKSNADYLAILKRKYFV